MRIPNSMHRRIRHSDQMTEYGHMRTAEQVELRLLSVQAVLSRLSLINYLCTFKHLKNGGPHWKTSDGHESAQLYALRSAHYASSCFLLRHLHKGGGRRFYLYMDRYSWA